MILSGLATVRTRQDDFANHRLVNSHDRLRSDPTEPGAPFEEPRANPTCNPRLRYCKHASPRVNGIFEALDRIDGGSIAPCGGSRKKGRRKGKARPSIPGLAPEAIDNRPLQGLDRPRRHSCNGLLHNSPHTPIGKTVCPGRPRRRHPAAQGRRNNTRLGKPAVAPGGQRSSMRIWERSATRSAKRRLMFLRRVRRLARSFSSGTLT